MRLSLLLLSLTTLVPSTQAADWDDRSIDRWEHEFKELDTYDTYAPTLKDKRGRWITPKPEILQLIELTSPEIKKAAELYGVEARVIAGAVLAENTMNVTISDSIQDFLVKYKIAPKGKVLGKKFTFGLGQLDLDVAMEVEPFAARIEKREKRTKEQVAEQLLNPASTYLYIGALMRDIQDIYGAAGFNLQAKPEILTTLYNLGGARSRVKETKKSGRAPRQNYFGFFVKHYQADIDKALASTGEVPTPEGMQKILVAQKDIDLRTSPPHCSIDGRADEVDYVKTETLREFPAFTTVSSGKSLTVISPGLGCGLEPWSLVKSTEGKIGWVKDNELTANAKTTYSTVAPCPSPQVPACTTSLQSLVGAQLLETNEAESLVRISGDQNLPLDWKDPLIGKAASRRGNASNSTVDLTSADVAEILAVAEAQYKETLAAAGDRQYQEILKANPHAKREDVKPQWSDNKFNPYSPLFTQFEQEGDWAWGSFRKCANRPKEFSCTSQVSKEEILGLLAIKLPPNPNFATLKKRLLGEQSIQFRAQKISAAGGGNILTQLRREMKEVVESCRKAVTSLPKARESLDRLLAEIEAYSPAAYAGSHTYLLDSLKQLRNTCSTFDPGIEMSVKNEVDNRISSTCQVPYNTPQMSGSFSLGKDLLRSILRTEAEKDDFLSDALYEGGIKLVQQSSSRNEAKSAYDPFATADLLEKILAEPCVRAVYVPDPWLLKKLNNQSGRLLYRPFLESDRFAVDTSTGKCESGDKK